LAAILSTVLITEKPWYHREFFLVVFTILLLPMLLRLLPGKEEILQQKLPAKWMISGGVFAGLATALSGLGGGVILHPYLHGLGNLDMRKTLPLSLGVMLFSSGCIIAYHLVFGQMLLGIKGIIPALVLPVVAGSILTAPLGVMLSHKLPVRTIKWIFVVFTLLLILRNLYLIIF